MFLDDDMSTEWNYYVSAIFIEPRTDLVSSVPESLPDFIWIISSDALIWKKCFQVVVHTETDFNIDIDIETILILLLCNNLSKQEK